MAFRHRLVRVPAVLITTLSLLLGAAAPVAAASSIVVNIQSSPILVTRGNPVSYVVSVRNTGGNAVNHVTLESDTPPGFTYARTVTNKGTCNAAPASEPFCDLGKFTSGTQAVAVLIFNVAPTAQLRTFDFEVVVHASEGTTDETHSAHTDTFRDEAPTTVLATNQNFTTHYIVPQGDDITTGGLTGSTALSLSNPQGTRAVVPGTTLGVPASVRESGGASTNCPAVFVGRCFGQSSTVSVGNGAVLSPYLKVEVRFNASAIPYWLTDHKLVIIHWFDPVGSAGYEQITRICSDSTPNGWELPCRLHAQVKPDGDWFVTVFMRSNGTIKGKG